MINFTFLQAVRRPETYVDCPRAESTALSICTCSTTSPKCAHLESATFPIQTSVDSPRLTQIGMARRARKAC